MSSLCKPNHFNDRGLTLVETVVAVIGLLLFGGIVLAVHQTQLASRTQCQPGLKQLGLALQQYHSQYERFTISSPQLVEHPVADQAADVE